MARSQVDTSCPMFARVQTSDPGSVLTTCPAAPTAHPDPSANSYDVVERVL